MKAGDQEKIRIDRTPTGPGGGFEDGETAFLRFTLDHRGVPFLDDLGGGWVAGDGPGWILHYRDDSDSGQGETEFFPGIDLVDEEGARRAAGEFLAGRRPGC